MSKKDAAILLMVLGVGGYCSYAHVTGTGPIGWLNYAQRAIFGSYSETGSYILAVFLLIALAILALAAWEKVGKSRPRGKKRKGPRTRATPPPAPAPPLRMALQIMIFFLLATWAIGFALYWSYATEQRENAGRYTPVDLSGGAPLPRPLGSLIELRGGVPLDALVHLVEEDDLVWRANRFVPIASRGWVKGQAVTFVVMLKGSSELTKRLAAAQDMQVPAGILMARITGPVPGPEALEFKQRGIQLGEPNYLLRLVQTTDTRLIMKSIEEHFMLFLGACGLLSTSFCLTAVIVWFMLPKQARRIRRQRGNNDG